MPNAEEETNRCLGIHCAEEESNVSWECRYQAREAGSGDRYSLVVEGGGAAWVVD